MRDCKHAGQELKFVSIKIVTQKDERWVKMFVEGAVNSDIKTWNVFLKCLFTFITLEV